MSPFMTSRDKDKDNINLASYLKSYLIPESRCEPGTISFPTEFIGRNVKVIHAQMCLSFKENEEAATPML